MTDPSTTTGSRIALAVRGLFVTLLFAGTVLGAQAQGAQPALSHTIRARTAQDGGGLNVLRRPAAPLYNVVALRVEFQPDSSRFTTGPGVFTDSLYRGIEVSIDPLPHDAGYFEAHLAFLEDYVERVSDGQTVVQTHLVPEIVRLSQPMAAYSPTGFDSDSDAELAKLAAFVREAWALATAQSAFDPSGFDPATTAFVLFHAGAGRDLELTGTTLDRTPQDLPSLFFDEPTLSRLSPGDPIVFNGAPVTSSLILPETESRLGRDFIADQDFVAEFSINGLLAASFFSYLGVPDLFNTEEGTSAIGPFGLMDPLGIFALNGLMPPEPSAWTKQYLGWTNPVEVDPTMAQVVSLDAVAVLGSSDVVRVPISAAEYFLVENRQRVPERDDLVLTVYRDGALVEQRIPLGTEGFQGFNVEAFEGGVVVAADPYDWALPGTADDELGRRFDGGIVIWHIDERVLLENIATNRVNADADRRGVDVEEADGAQDLGTTSDFGVESGTPFDFWFEGNPVSVIAEGDTLRLYQNRFGPDTFPSSNANGGGISFVELADFSASASTMTLTVRASIPDGGAVLPRTALWQDLDLMATSSTAILQAGDGADEVIAVQAQTTSGDRSAFRLLRGDGTAILGLDGAFGAPVVTPDGLIAVLGDSFAGSFRIRLFNASGEVDAYAYEPEGTVKSLRAGGPIIPTGLDFYVVVDTDGGGRVARLTREADGFTLLDTAPLSDVQAITVDEQRGLVAVGPEGIWTAGGFSEVPFGDSAMFGEAAFGHDGCGLITALPSPGDGTLRLARSDCPDPRPIGLERLGDGALSPFVTLADVNADGSLDVLTAVGNRLAAFTQGGAVADGFPIDLPTPLSGRILVAFFDDAPLPTVLVSGQDGNLYAYDLNDSNRLRAGFPLPVGQVLSATPRLSDDGTLLAVTDDGQLRAWTLDGLGPIAWGGLYGDVSNRSVALNTGSPGETPSPEGGLAFLDETETYNWPNPIREGLTNIRFQTSEPATVTVTIVDLSGALVETLTVESLGGTPEEIEWRTDAPSGVYFARVTATTPSGREASHLIRMALIR